MGTTRLIGKEFRDKHKDTRSTFGTKLGLGRRFGSRIGTRIGSQKRRKIGSRSRRGNRQGSRLGDKTRNWKQVRDSVEDKKMGKIDEVSEGAL